MKKLTLGTIIGIGCLVFSIAGCESVERMGKSIKSSTTGIERKVVWTGFDGTKKVWEGKFKLDSNEGSPTVYFINEEGKTVVLGTGWYSIEK